MHVHIGVIMALSSFASVIIVGFFWRLMSMHISDSPIGQAMAFVY
jgi:hypothetical protein